jgi:hypothetical protein
LIFEESGKEVVPLISPPKKTTSPNPKKRDDAVHLFYYSFPPPTEDPRSYGTGIKHSAKRRSQFNHATLPRRLGHRALVAARLLHLS